MRLNLSILLMLVMSAVVLAGDGSDGDWGTLFKTLVVLAFFTPIGWGILFALIIGFCSWMVKSTKAVVTADYRKIPESEKRDRFLEELKK